MNDRVVAKKYNHTFQFTYDLAVICYQLQQKNFKTISDINSPELEAKRKNTLQFEASFLYLEIKAIEKAFFGSF